MMRMVKRKRGPETLENPLMRRDSVLLSIPSLTTLAYDPHLRRFFSHQLYPKARGGISCSTGDRNIETLAITSSKGQCQ